MVIFIESGDFPPQTVLKFGGEIKIKTFSKTKKKYLLRASIKNLFKISEDGNNVTYNMDMEDGCSVVCISDKATYDELEKEKDTPKKAGDYIVKDIPRPHWFRRILNYIGIGISIIILSFCSIVVAISDKSEEEDRAITDDYYGMISRPGLTPKEKQALKCSGAASTLYKYKSRGDEKGIKEWEGIHLRECTKLREMKGY